MFRYSLSGYIFTLALLEAIVKTHLTVHDNGHGFIGGNQRYFDDDFIMHEELSSGLRSVRINDVANIQMQLRFEPTVLDFKHRPLGVPHLETVTLFNVHRNKSIDMTSISGSTVHFHSSFFEDKKIPPLGNTTFTVVFLGREEGYVESSLFIHTTEGHFKYNVKGASIYSPYRLRPIVGIKLPINASFSPLIYMHNPHTEPMQIIEVYSSGGEFHLELPTGEMEGPQDMWMIPPLQTRAVIRVRFQAKAEQNHTAYVRIKVNSSEETLVVPLEVQVSGGGGIFDPQGSIDFGIGGSLDSPKEVGLCVFNPHKKAVRINSVSTSSEAVKVKFDANKLIPGAKAGRSECVKIGSLVLDWKTAFRTKDFAGKVVIKYKNGKSKTEVIYYATVLEGGISYDPSVTRYFINDKMEALASRSFKVKNNFLSTVRIINFSLPEEVRRYYKVESFKSTVLRPQQEAAIFTIKLRSGVQVSDLKVNSHILVKTNISDFLVPLLSYSGKLQVHLPFKSKDYSLDLGLISFESTKVIHFLLFNSNPVNIAIKRMSTSIAKMSATLVGCGKGNHRTALLQVSFQNLTKCNNLKTDEYAVIRLNVDTTTIEGQTWGDVMIETQYERLSVPVHFKVAPGKLEIGPDRLVFDQCFPGKICSHPLRVHSTFNDPMVIEGIVSLPPDGRLSSRHTGHILARATKVIGHLYLDPMSECGRECYTGLKHESTAQWLKTISLARSVADFDLNLVNMFYNRYLNQTANGLRRWQNLTLRLDTSEVKGHLFKTRVKMSWPNLLVDQNADLNRSTFVFPLTQVGNVSYRNITLRNPSSYSLIIQLVMDRDYPEMEQVRDGLPGNFLPPGGGDEEGGRYGKHGFFFHSSFKDYRRLFVDVLNLNVHERSLPVILPPSHNFTFTVGFMGIDETPNSALIFVRNNLTILELIRLKGQGAHPVFKFGNRKPGSSQPLLFEVTDKHAKECEQKKGPTYSLVVRRSFTAKNTGEVTIYVNGFYINDLPCEGYGFKVLNCAPFALHPNASRKIDMAFTPDFTLSKVTRLLVLDTSLNFLVNYTLHATIPPFYLGLCWSSIERPYWEPHLGLMVFAIMTVLLCGVIVFAVMEHERIRGEAQAALEAASAPPQARLDLRAIGQQARAEIQNASTKVDPRAVADDTIGSCKKTLADDGNSSRSISNHIIINNNNNDSIKSFGSVSDDCVRLPKDGGSCGERYSALIPVVGRSKKRLAKKNSNESTALTTHTGNDVTRKPPPPPSPPSNEAITQQVGAAAVTGTKRRHCDDKKPVTACGSSINTHKKSAGGINTSPTGTSPKGGSHKLTKANGVPAYEEETSSTTTESSSNNDENDKENDHQINSKHQHQHHVGVTKQKFKSDSVHNSHINSGNNSSSSSSSSSNNISNGNIHSSNHSHHSSGDIGVSASESSQPKSPMVIVAQHGKIERRRSGPKAQGRGEARGSGEKHAHAHEGGGGGGGGGRKSHKGRGERKDKQHSSGKRLSSDKNGSMSKAGASGTGGGGEKRDSPPIIRTSPSIPCSNVWGENRATFSDVVARSDATNAQGRSLPTATQNKLFNGEQYKAAGSELGPIGSRRMDFWQQQQQEGGNSGVGGGSSQGGQNGETADGILDGQSNSFFSNAQDLAVESGPSFLDSYVTTADDENWPNSNEVQFVRQLLQGCGQENFLQGSSWDPAEGLLNSPSLSHSHLDSYWNSTYSPLAENLATVQQQSDVDQQPNQSSTYMWSSSVWHPWTPPEVSRTPTRTPPGFDAFQPPRSQEESSGGQQQEQREVYNPFGLNNIWNRPSANPWDYQGQ